jgi:hypothetical protein
MAMQSKCFLYGAVQCLIISLSLGRQRARWKILFFETQRREKESQRESKREEGLRAMLKGQGGETDSAVSKETDIAIKSENTQESG